jgi:membrane protein implicated in regulation of membrane protease activity
LREIELRRGIVAKQRQASVGEFVGELADLLTGLGLVVFTLAPFAVPLLALSALASAALLIPAAVGVVLAAPWVLARRWRRSPNRATRQRRSASLPARLDHRVPSVADNRGQP